VATRRRFLRTSAIVLAGFAVPALVRAARPVEIRMVASPRGEHVSFDPIGVRIKPGQAVRWLMASPGNPHTTTSYHPKNANRSLRIPEAAAPWDSGFLVNAGDTFEVTLTVEGVYDYFCLPHEAAGMVGRIVVGRPGGPGALPFDYFVGRPEARNWMAVPEAARAAFPTVATILRAPATP
jgi:plastocyanin